MQGGTLDTTRSMVHEWVDTGAGDTLWVRSQSGPIPAAGTSVTQNATAPANEQWNFASIEIYIGNLNTLFL